MKLINEFRELYIGMSEDEIMQEIIEAVKHYRYIKYLREKWGHDIVLIDAIERDDSDDIIEDFDPDQISLFDEDL
jgi:hypothetical protein